MRKWTIGEKGGKLIVWRMWGETESEWRRRQDGRCGGVADQYEGNAWQKGNAAMRRKRKSRGLSLSLSLSPVSRREWWERSCSERQTDRSEAARWEAAKCAPSGVEEGWDRSRQRSMPELCSGYNQNTILENCLRYQREHKNGTSLSLSLDWGLQSWHSNRQTHYAA